MYTNILVATDGSELGTKALQHALAINKPDGTRITVVTVTDPSLWISPGSEIAMIDTGTILAEMDKARDEGAKQVLVAAKAVADAAGVAIETLHVSDPVTADGIIAVATERGCDLIVMGSHGRRGLGRLLLGSQAAEVLARSTVPVLIVK